MFPYSDDMFLYSEARIMHYSYISRPTVLIFPCPMRCNIQCSHIPRPTVLIFRCPFDAMFPPVRCNVPIFRGPYDAMFSYSEAHMILIHAIFRGLFVQCSGANSCKEKVTITMPWVNTLQPVVGIVRGRDVCSGCLLSVFEMCTWCKILRHYAPVVPTPSRCNHLDQFKPKIRCKQIHI